ncbi:hypothetical protein [Paenibacillus beijingensis]|uniref:Uncharacterized protein n=1 Tax=Paenibacillus beijingensis TaxID=1126833 RepID=A0A0D5NGE1_9BACL|nr:hypothetical protein [Paenibacillus beijingensis]AJY74042.1 hypothetical protein VN24_04760 [Paenibacillus beijingensis]
MGEAVVINIIFYVIGLFILYEIIIAAVRKGIESSEIVTRLEFQAEQNEKIIELLSEIKKGQEKQ